jgi:hypothetical protein
LITSVLVNSVLQTNQMVNRLSKITSPCTEIPNMEAMYESEITAIQF